MIQLVVKPVVKAVWQPVVSCIQTFNRFDNRLYRVNGVQRVNALRNYSRKKLTPLKILTQMQSSRPQKATLLAQKHASYDEQIARSLWSVQPFFAQLILLSNPQIPMFYNAFQSARHPKSAPSRSSICIPMFPGPTRLSISNCIPIGSAVFPQLTAESHYTLRYALKYDYCVI